MRWTTHSIWRAIGIVLVTYLACALVGYVSDGATTDAGTAMILVYGPVMVINPLVTMVVAGRDGLKEGLSLLWIIAPFLCFLIPVALIYSEHMWKLGVVYSVLGTVAHLIGLWISYRRSHARTETDHRARS